jgi:hypothetical protein
MLGDIIFAVLRVLTVKPYIQGLNRVWSSTQDKPILRNQITDFQSVFDEAACSVCGCYTYMHILVILYFSILLQLFNLTSMYAYFHSLMKYGIIFWGNSFDIKKVFTLQKKIVRIMMGVKSHNSCRGLFKRLQILTCCCEYIYIQGLSEK